ncbi:cytochrome P450 4C1-like [Anopheles cruzii]|uniref:cytochrome P450 4C1-like n=1 Tax=Anopheles cruzii TaxID=68878 RepID=UPI0022EC253C|nr:cytochrome P450 4C1-like [Anopheles cruzii]XP_052863032.1 cytochrome P450 4C1-like [Anopheles cruzii]
MAELTTVLHGVLSFLVFAVLLNWLLKRWQLSQIYDKIPGPKAYPFVGTMYSFFGKKHHEIFYVIDKRTRTYPNIHRLWTGLVPEVRVTKAEYVEQVISSSKHMEKSMSYRFLHAWLGDGLLTSKGERWFQHRKLITPTFHFNILDGFCDVFDENSQVLVEQLQPHADTGTPVNVFPFIAKAALDIICETAMGVKVNAQREENVYVNAVYEISGLFLDRLVRPWLHIDFFWERSQFAKRHKTVLSTIHGYVRSVIRDRKAALAKSPQSDLPSDVVDDGSGKKKRLAFLDLLLQGNQVNNLLTDEDVREEVDTFMFEGHDTTSAGISWVLFLLALHPDIQERVYEEIESAHGTDDTKPVSMQELGELKLLERCIKESLRLYPSVPFFGRTTTEDMQLGGYHVPSGTIVGIQSYHVHRDERFFPDPETFDPDRFLPENTESRHPYAYIPFSAGPRNCIGQKFALLEEKSVISRVLRRFRLRSVRTRDQQLILQELIARPKDGILLYLESRK